MNVTLSLKKGEESKELNLNLISVGAIKTIKQHMKDGWELTDAQGDNPAIINYIKNEISKYNANKENYRGSIIETVKAATSVIKPKGKIHLSRRQLLLAKFRKKEKQ